MCTILSKSTFKICWYVLKNPISQIRGLPFGCLIGGGLSTVCRPRSHGSSCAGGVLNIVLGLPRVCVELLCCHIIHYLCLHGLRMALFFWFVHLH